MGCNSESRRAINYSQQEPINNKYDLWLSENLRYNSEGSLIYDSPGQPACDLILKIYKDGDWRPIAGLNTEHIVANKINIVDGVNYTYISPNDNAQHTNNGFQQNHLPLFRNPQDSPNELFDAGTLGNAIYGFVTESEWQNIFEGYAFSGAFTYWFPTIINNGDININDFIELATTERIGGILSDTHESQAVYAFKPVEVKFYPNTWHNDQYNGRLSINAWDVQEALNEIWQEHPGSEIISGWKGIETQLRDGQQGIWVGLSGVTPENTGKFCTVQLDNTDTSGATIDWVNLSDYQIYPVLSSNSSEDIKYVINGGGKEGTYLDYNGEWTVPDKNVYYGGSFIDIDHDNIIDIKPYTGQNDTSKFYICSENGSVSWKQINTETIYVQGVGITIDNQDNTINIETNDATKGQILSYDGDGDVEWINPPSQVEGNGVNTFVVQNKIYIKPYNCIISENEFVLDPEVPISNTYQNSIYPFIDFTDYQVESGVSSITIESSGSSYLQYTSYMHFTTSATKCTFTFPKTMEFIETMSVNSSTGETYYYTPTDYVIQLKPETKYNVTFYKSCIKFETNSNSIFNQPLN